MLTRRALPAAAARPERPILRIVPFPPAGSLGRLIPLPGARLAQRLGQPVPGANRAGAGGTPAAAILAQARGGLHLTMVGHVSHAISPA